MTDAVHIGRLRARYRVRGDADRARARLDAALGRVVDGALEAALRRLGVPEGEEVCLRALREPVRLSLDATDAAVAEAWAAALARALRDRIAAGDGVVRFRSLRHALLDLVASAARGDLGRAWAWAQVGLWDERVDGSAGAGEAIAAALCALPDAAPAVLAEVARRGALPALLARVPAPAWPRVAGAALRAHRAGRAAVEALTGGPPGSAHASPRGDAERRAGRIAGRAAVVAALRALGRVPAGALRPLLALAALDAEPEALAGARPEGVLGALERAVPWVAAHPRARDAASPAPTPARGAPDAREGAPDLPGNVPPRGEPDGATRAPLEPRPGVATRAGGLLFLLHVVADLGLPSTLCAPGGPLARRSLRYALHALALTLLPIEAPDPAALAFCGLGPAAATPCQGEPPLDDAERPALEAAAAAVSARLRARLGRTDEPARAVLLETCRRDAEIVADPGWLEVRLALDGVDVRVRRVGLDLDPGWLPWLGCVVRFVYG